MQCPRECELQTSFAHKLLAPNYDTRKWEVHIPDMQSSEVTFLSRKAGSQLEFTAIHIPEKEHHHQDTCQRAERQGEVDAAVLQRGRKANIV